MSDALMSPNDESQFTVPELVRALQALNDSVISLRLEIKDEAKNRRDELGRIEQATNDKLTANSAAIAVLQVRYESLSATVARVETAANASALVAQAAATTAATRAEAAQDAATMATQTITALREQLAEKRKTWDGYIGGAIGAGITALVEWMIRR